MSSSASRQIDDLLASMIEEQGGTYAVADARHEMATVLKEARADNEAQGKNPDEPSFSFSVAGGVAVLTVYRAGLDIYVVRCDQASEPDLIGRFEPLASADVAGSLEILRTVYDKRVPDLTIGPLLKTDWLFGVR